MHQSTILVFNSLHQLWEFAKEINIRSVEILVSKKTLICECTEEQIRMAEEKYGARQHSMA